MTYSPSDSQKRILVVSPPYRLSQAGFPLGLMYIAAVLQRAGHHVEVIDMDVLNLPMDEYIRELKNREYDYFCTGGMITAWNFITVSCDMVKKVKPRAKIIVGGGIISSTPESFLSVSQVDVGVIGEGEETVLEIIDSFENGRSLADIPGIVYREDKKVIETKHRHYLEDLDSLPFPAWDLFNVKDTYCLFPSHYSVFKAKRVASVYTTRGCPFQCTFCYTEKGVRQRSVENVIQEFKELKGKYGVGYINIADDLFVVRKKRTIEFCEAMIKHKINLQWSAAGRCNIVEPKFLKLLKRAGCEFLGLGIESGSDMVLKAIKKSQTPQQVVEAVKMVKEAGITPGGTFILGLPPETKETVRETVEIYKKINTYRTHVNKFFFATPYPSTELYTQMKAAGKIKDEIRYFELISERGDAVDFCINCTKAFTDDELVCTKKEIEQEVFEDFRRKHPIFFLLQFLSEKTALSKINNLLVSLKMKGFHKGITFIWEKVLIKFKLIPNRYVHRWNVKKTTYAWQQTLYQGQMPTF